jgi:TolB-like protein
MRRFWGLVIVGAANLLMMQALVNAQAGDKDKEKDKEKDKASEIYPAALFTFEERGAGVRDFGAKITDILFAKLAARPELYLVDRSDLKKILGELELNISGVVKPSEANKIGQMTGAKILISGSVIQVDKKTYLVAKIIGTETSRVLAASVDGKSTDELAPLVEKLAEQVAETIAKKGDQLVAKVTPKTDRIEALNKKLKGKRPTVMVQIKERHIGALKIDPAAETEVSKFCKETGFTLIDPENGVKGKADILIVGEAFSETATRHGNLISVKARVEIKAIDRKTDKILAVDRQTALVVDLTENIAGKAAIQEAAAILAERILPKLVK